MTLNITISPAGRGHFDARLGDRILCKSVEVPFFRAARVLLAEGVPPETPLTLSHAANEDRPCLTSTVGAAARLTIIENDRDGIRFAPYRAYPAR